MNADLISNNPNINGGIKKITREEATTIVDLETGDIVRQINIKAGAVGREPDYIKIYTDCMLVLNKIDIALSPYIVAFARHMTYANHKNPDYRCTVRTDEMVRQDVAAYCGVTDRRVKQAIKALVEAEVFIPIKINGKTKRGIYFVNPWVVGKGEWSDIKQLRGQFEFISGASSVVSIDECGDRKVIMPLTVPIRGEQLCLEDYISTDKGEEYAEECAD